MRDNEKFSEALRFFIEGATPALKSCHLSEVTGYRAQKGARPRATLPAIEATLRRTSRSDGSADLRASPVLMRRALSPELVEMFRCPRPWTS
jgi:hypothetical protein